MTIDDIDVCAAELPSRRSARVTALARVLLLLAMAATVSAPLVACSDVGSSRGGGNRAFLDTYFGSSTTVLPGTGPSYGQGSLVAGGGASGLVPSSVVAPVEDPGTLSTSIPSAPTGTGRTCEIHILLSSMDYGDGSFPIPENEVGFGCLDGGQVIMEASQRSDFRSDEVSVTETPERDTIVSGLTTSLEQAGWQQVGRGAAWYSWRFQEG